MATFYAGFSETVPTRTVNRQCSSSLQAVDVVTSIKGFYVIGIAASLESMTVDTLSWDASFNPRVEKHRKAQDCLLQMGITSENVAQRFGVSRHLQDQAAVRCHRHAVEATAVGRFKDEIIPREFKSKIIISLWYIKYKQYALRNLKPVFKKDGSTTVGIIIDLSDGVGIVLLMRRAMAMHKALSIMGICRSFAIIRVDPKIMGVAPIIVILVVINVISLQLIDIQLF
eukprot:Gb_15535 [translate_table: standard]